MARTGKVTFETAGALGHGERVWVLAKVTGEMCINGCDVVEKYLLFSTGHDGRTPVQIRFTPVRVVCQNTLIVSLASGLDLFKITHLPGMQKSVHLAERAVERIFHTYEEIEETCQRLASEQLTTGRLDDYLSAVFPEPTHQDGRSNGRYKAAIRRAWERREYAIELFEAGTGNQDVAIRGTLWAAYNGVVELIDHQRKRYSPERRMAFACFGEGERIKRLAFQKAKEFMLSA